jgi:hypothetical protein
VKIINAPQRLFHYPCEQHYGGRDDGMGIGVRLLDRAITGMTAAWQLIW